MAQHRAKLYGDAFPGDNEETKGESVSATTYSPRVRGPRAGGRVSIQISWDAALTGTLELWRTNLRNPNEANDADWVQDTTWPPVNPAGAAGKTFVETSAVTWEWFRVKLVFTSGSANVYGWAVVEDGPGG